LSGALIGLPPPASLATETLTRLDRDRVRAVRGKDGSWAFNYSLVKLEAPELAARLTVWADALSEAVAPLRINSLELTFTRPPEGERDAPDGELAFSEFSRTCVDLIGRVAPAKDVLVSLFWTSTTSWGQECLDDWRLELRPVSDQVDEAGETLLRTLEPWLEGLDQMILHLDYVVDQGAGQGVTVSYGASGSQESV
jgi:hypothetical protein